MIQQKSKWPRQSLVVVSQSPNLHMLLRELLRSFNWVVEESNQSVAGAIEAVNSGRAYLIVVDDTIEDPAVSIVRELINDPIACCTPTLTFLLDHHMSDASALTKLGSVEIVSKPLTPSKFLPGFSSLIQKWETRQYLTLRMGLQQYLRAGPECGYNAMKKLVALEEIFPLVAQNMSLFYRNNGNLHDAEKILLHALKKNPKNLGLMIALGDLYMRSAMPKMAMRLFLGARTICGDTMAIYPDLVQASLILGRYQEAIDFLLTMYRREFKLPQTSDFLTRVQFADGRSGDAEKILAIKKIHFKKMQAIWQAAASDSFSEAS